MQALWMLVASLQYSAIVFSATLGVLVFADRIAPAGWTGMAVVIGSGALATWLAQRRPRAKDEPILSVDIR